MTEIVSSAEDLAKANGFESADEMFRLVSSADLKTPEKLSAFTKWQQDDGSKSGLLKLGKPETFVAFSGGKDSTALALLMTEAQPVFTDTGWEFDEVYAHIDKFERVTGRQVLRLKGEETLPEYIKRAAFLPGHGARFCTRLFKIKIMNDFLTDHRPADLCIGLRADEPEDMRVGNLTELEGLSIRYPLREQEMVLADVLRLCVQSDLLPRYPVYMARGGCKGCFYKRKSEVQAMAVMLPDVMDELQALEESVQDERGKFAFMFPNANASIRQIRSQPMLFTAEEVYGAAADKSDMGTSCGLFCNR